MNQNWYLEMKAGKGQADFHFVLTFVNEDIVWVAVKLESLWAPCHGLMQLKWKLFDSTPNFFVQNVCKLHWPQQNAPSAPCEKSSIKAVYILLRNMILTRIIKPESSIINVYVRV